LDTITNELHNQIFDFDLLAPSTQAVIRLAQYEATKMNAPEVYPEHLFLAVLRQDDVEVAIVLKHIGFDGQKIQSQLVETFGNLTYDDTENNILFSRESQSCFEWTISVATQMNSSLIFPKHLILSVLRHPRIQPLLVLLFSSQDQDVLPAPLMEVEGRVYTSYIDQLIHSRVREQSVIKYNHSSLKRVFKGFERPHTTFADIQGLEGAKDKLREVVDFLRKPQIFQRSMKTYLYGVLIVGHPCTDRTLLVKATAGEAVVPLMCLSLSAVVEVLSDLESDVLSLDDLYLPKDEHDLLAKSELPQSGRKMIAHIFSQAKKLSPCVLFFDNLDALFQLPTSQVREQWLKQLVIEMDGLDDYPPMAVIATTSHNYQFDQALLQPGRFEHQIVMSSSIMAHPVAQTKLCLSCKSEVLATWKYCVYCGAFMAQTCPNCGTLFMQLEGARFCSECGTLQSGTQ
jgi:ATPase family associated with various cellular activities (AAA)/Clp amino terminal domain, pathogenicity island component